MINEFNLNKLLSHRLLIVSGKGGVGKTTVSLALGLLAAERRLKTIIAEIHSDEQIAHLLERPPIGYQETELLPNLWGMNVLPKKSFEEYVLRQIRFRGLYKAVFENRFVRRFIEATPGLSELTCIGKVYDLAKHYDLVIVDAPATGHGVALLSIPSVVSRAIRVGPLKSEAEKVNQLLHDRVRTEVVLVTLPEEMPVAETVELSHNLEQKMELSVGPVFLNQVLEEPFTARERSEWEGLSNRLRERNPLLRRRVEHRMARSGLSRDYTRRLAGEMKGRPVVTIPFLFSARFGLGEIETVAAEIEASS